MYILGKGEEMKKIIKRIASFVLAALLVLAMAVPSFAEDNCITVKRATIMVDVLLKDNDDQWGLRGDGVHGSPRCRLSSIPIRVRPNTVGVRFLGRIF